MGRVSLLVSVFGPLHSLLDPARMGRWRNDCIREALSTGKWDYLRFWNSMSCALRMALCSITTVLENPRLRSLRLLARSSSTSLRSLSLLALQELPLVMELPLCYSGNLVFLLHLEGVQSELAETMEERVAHWR